MRRRVGESTGSGMALRKMRSCWRGGANFEALIGVYHDESRAPCHGAQNLSPSNDRRRHNARVTPRLADAEVELAPSAADWHVPNARATRPGLDLASPRPSVALCAGDSALALTTLPPSGYALVALHPMPPLSVTLARWFGLVWMGSLTSTLHLPPLHDDVRVCLMAGPPLPGPITCLGQRSASAGRLRMAFGEPGLAWPSGFFSWRAPCGSAV